MNIHQDAQEITVGGKRICMWKGLNLWFAWPTGCDTPVVEDTTQRGAIIKLMVQIAKLEESRNAS